MSDGHIGINISANYIGEPFTTASNEVILYLDCGVSTRTDENLDGAMFYIERRNANNEWRRYPHMTFDKPDAWELQVMPSDQLRVVIEDMGSQAITYQITPAF